MGLNVVMLTGDNLKTAQALSLIHIFQPLKEYLAQPKEVKVQHLEAFCADMLEKIGPMEEQLTGAEQACRAQVMG